MSRYTRTPTNIEVTPLNLMPLYDEVLTYVRDKAQFDRDHGQPEKKMPKAVKPSEYWGIVEVGDEVYAICTEGVGPEQPVTEEHKLAIDFLVDGYEDDDNVYIEMMPAATARFTPDELRSVATGEPVNLETWIRSFGSRLHTNYEVWRKLLTSKSTA